MAKVDIWMPIYIGDYLRDTTELSGPEHGAYLLLLMHYWMKKGEIGSDIERLARACHSEVETCRFILGLYFTLEDGNYKNKRADREMEIAEVKRLVASENGKKGGRPPKHNPEKTHSFNLALENESKTKAKRNPEKSSSPSPIYNNISKKEESELSTGVPNFEDDSFDEPQKRSLPEQSVKLASLLFTLHRDNQDASYKVSQANLEKWAADIDKLNRIDGRSWEDIETIIRWVKSPGQFWAPNIMSGSKLREKFPALLVQSKQTKMQNGKPLKVQERTAFLDMED